VIRKSRRYLTIWLAAVTPLGWMVTAFGALCWVGGVFLGWRELMVVAGSAITLLAMAIAFTIGRLELESSVSVSPSRVVVGDRAAGELKLRNPRSRGANSVRVELPVGEAVAVFALRHLRGGEETNELFSLPTNRRAVIPVGPVSTVQGDPLGLLRRTEVWSDVTEIFVHPKTAAVETIAAGLIRDMEGQATNKLSPSDVAFHTLRDYVLGDDLRHVHWKSSAKLNKLQVRQYVDTRRSHVAVLLSTDLGEYEDEDEFELSVSCAASVATRAIMEDQTLSMIAGGDLLPTNSVNEMLDKFSRIEGAIGEGGIDECLKTSRTAAVNASVVVLCTGSRPDIPQIRQASARISIDAGMIVLRSDLACESSYQPVGSSTFVNVPSLDQLARGLSAVST